MKSTLLPFILLSSLVGFLTVAKADQAPVTIAPVYNEQTVYYISGNNVRVRSAPDASGKVLGELSLNDRVKVINPSIIYDQKYIEIIVVRTFDPIIKSEKYFILAEYLSPKLVDYKVFTGKYFVVVNVASETLRLYERVCPDNSCPNKMIMETEVVVGEDKNLSKEEKGKGRSILGSYRVTGWSKFYQDPEGHYPAWYRDGYPPVPDADSSWRDWFSKKVLPADKDGNKIGKMRGAFGWYTAFVSPEPFGQWTHGTLGWGSDKDRYIRKVKKKLINIVSAPRSSGCTRNNNEAIAFIRKMIDVGAPIVKIYAKEGILDPTLSNYPNVVSPWKYVLTKNKSHAVDRDEVLKFLGASDGDLDAFWQAKRDGGKLVLNPNDPLNQVLEVGTYEFDHLPDAIEFIPGEKLSKFDRKLGRNGNVYGVKGINMHGVYYVDAGMLEGYSHPDAILEASGFADEVTPSWMSITNLKK